MSDDELQDFDEDASATGIIERLSYLGGDLSEDAERAMYRRALTLTRRQVRRLEAMVEQSLSSFHDELKGTREELAKLATAEVARTAREEAEHRMRTAQANTLKWAVPLGLSVGTTIVGVVVWLVSRLPA